MAVPNRLDQCATDEPLYRYAGLVALQDRPALLAPVQVQEEDQTMSVVT